MSPWKFPLLALLFLAFCNFCGDASADDLEITGYGDDGTTSYASEYGEAEFGIFVTSLSDSEHNNVTFDVSFADDWSGEAEVTDCNGGEVQTTLAEGETISACIYVSIAESDSEIGDSADMAVNVTSDDDAGSEMWFGIRISNWFAYSDDDAKTFELDTIHIYTITVENIKVDEDGEPVEIDDDIEIALYTALFGWDIDSDDVAWDSVEMMATINYIAAGDSYDLELDIQLIDDMAPASSYVGNSNIIFTVNDGTVYVLVTLEAIVADHFATEITGAGDQHVDNGCSDTAVSVTWDAVIKNFGNRPDSFSYTFDTSSLPSGWTVDGATGSNTGNLNAKFEGGEETVSLGMWIPGGLSAGSTGGFTMTATSDSDPAVSQTVSFSATVDQCYGMEMTVDSLMNSAVPGESTYFTISVTNTGNGPDTISFSLMNANAEWSPSLSELQRAVASGATRTTVFSMTVPSDAEANAASGDAMIHAYSSDGVVEKSVTVSAKAGQTYGVTADYYNNNASMASVSVQEGMSVQMKFNVTNNGNGNDEIILSLNNAPVWVTLGQTTALIGPGQAMTLRIDVAAPGSDAHGDYTFEVIAISSDGVTTATSPDMTVTVTAKSVTGGPLPDGIGGCTDPRTAEYNPNATFDDGSCPPVITGCTDFAAVNYRQTATVDDGSCKYAPTAVAGSDITVAEGEDVQFSGAGTDSDGNIVLYEWDFDGDGVYEWSSEENGRTTNIYNAAGEYSTSLRVTDADGNTAVDERLVTVTEAPQEKDEVESPVPSISLISALTLIALIAIFRRR